MAAYKLIWPMTSKIFLPQVTLFGIDAHNPSGLLRAADICTRGIEFGNVVMITERLFPGNSLQEGRENYSKFMIRNLTKYFHTSHVLTIHADGYIIRPESWSDEFMKYDFCGASWGYKDNKNVGNGGFSIRSKYLCSVLADAKEVSLYFPEDHHICRTYRPMLESDYGIRFAPEEVANRFSIEAYGSNLFVHGNEKGNLYSGQLGFHGPHVDFHNHEQYGIDQSILYKR